jgi:hypothetical protein
MSLPANSGGLLISGLAVTSVAGGGLTACRAAGSWAFAVCTSAVGTLVGRESRFTNRPVNTASKTPITTNPILASLAMICLLEATKQNAD